MTYFIDFDRTLFDFDSFFPYLGTIPGLEPLRERIAAKAAGNELAADNPERTALSYDINALYAEGRFSFEPDSLRNFVFPDSWEFLKKHGNTSVIVTSGSGDLSFQKGKVDASGVRSLVADAAFVPRGEVKGPTVLGLLDRHAGPYCFVDDLPEQIDSVVRACPGVVGYEIRRDGRAGSGTYQVIRTLGELPV